MIMEIFRGINVLDDMVAVDLVAVERLVKRLLAASGMTIRAPLRTREQKAAKLLFYILHREKYKFINRWLITHTYKKQAHTCISSSD